MNSNFPMAVYALLFLLFSCGVKSPPSPPKDTMLPSIDSLYLEQINPDRIDKRNKNKKKSAQ